MALARRAGHQGEAKACVWCRGACVRGWDLGRVVKGTTAQDEQGMGRLWVGLERDTDDRAGDGSSSGASLSRSRFW